MLQYSTTSSTVTSSNANAQVAGALKGKMRNTFGPLVVMNSNLQQMEITSPDYSTFTSAVETPVELLGAHEFYYWGFGQ
jgi:hypothetical protein